MTTQTCLRVALCAAGLAAFSIVPSPAKAATRTVTTCADSGAGSLRAMVAGAASGDTIDLRSLACNRIGLTSGAIAVPQDTLTVRGAGNKRITISGNWNSSIFRHSGTGTLFLRGMTMENGEHRDHDANGGCIASMGNVDGNDIVVRHCAAYAVRNALGGGIWAARNITLFYSAVYSNGAKGASSGGGALALGSFGPNGELLFGNVRAHRTRFLDNAAASGSAIRALGGLNLTYVSVNNNRARFSFALDAFGPTRIAYSTISGNTGVNQAAVFHLSAGSSIENSTISGNSAPFIAIGYINGDTSIVNSTIVDNRTETEFETNCFPGPILLLADVHIESSILARNTCNGTTTMGFDITGEGEGGPFPQPGPAVITGSDNLIQRSVRVVLPSDTITGVDPQLGPLADNGGRTLTHLPASTSPVLGRGNNIAGFTVDQRGEGFPRTNGARTDIGAVER